jgi:hypothetical protein
MQTPRVVESPHVEGLPPGERGSLSEFVGRCLAMRAG